MSISLSAQTWNRDDECGIAKAVKILELEADSKKDAEFLAAFMSCIRRGKIDAEVMLYVMELRSRMEDP